MSDAKETVHDPDWYTSGDVETIDKIEAVIDGLPAREAFLLGQVIRYVDRAGEKDDPATDLGKANNYAHRLVTGEWRGDDGAWPRWLPRSLRRVPLFRALRRAHEAQAWGLREAHGPGLLLRRAARLRERFGLPAEPDKRGG